MRRKLFMALTGLSNGTLKNMAKRFQLPFGIVPTTDEGETEGWAEYRLCEAAATLASVDLSEAGVSPQEAATLVARGVPFSAFSVIEASLSAADLYLVVGSFVGSTARYRMPYRAVGLSTLSELHKARLKGPVNTTVDLSAARSFLVVNLSDVVRRLNATAEREGITLRWDEDDAAQ